MFFFWPECQGAYFRLNHFSQQNWYLATKSVDFFSLLDNWTNSKTDIFYLNWSRQKQKKTKKTTWVKSNEFRFQPVIDIRNNNLCDFLIPFFFSKENKKSQKCFIFQNFSVQHFFSSCPDSNEETFLKKFFFSESQLLPSKGRHQNCRNPEIYI